jgi:hypothetical protein
LLQAGGVAVFGIVIAVKMVKPLSVESAMKQKTLLLFQLFLAVFAFYAVLKYSGNQRLIVAFFCLFGMFVVGKVETMVTEGDGKEEGKGRKTAKKAEKALSFEPTDTLLKSKNVLLLIDAIHYILKDLGLAVSRSPNQSSIDRLVRAPDKQTTFGLKILGDVAELTENWNSWEELSDFDQGRGGKKRLLLIGSNTVQEGGGDKPQFVDFSANTQSLLTSRSVVAMTTLTLYKIYMLCKKKSVDPSVILDLIHRHPGGVFRLEQYMKRPTQAA